MGELRTRQTVTAGQNARVRAEVAALTDVGKPARARRAVYIAIWQGAATGERIALDHGAGDVVVARVPDEPAEGELEWAIASVHARTAANLVVHALGDNLSETVETVHPPRGDGVRHHVHHSAHCAAVEDRGRAAQDLDLSGAKGVGSDLVVGADGRHVAYAETVVQHLHPRPVEAPDDRAPRARGESAGLDAELGVQGVAEVGGLVAAQAVSAQYGRGLRHLELTSILKRLRGDDDRGEACLLCRAPGGPRALDEYPRDGGSNEGLVMHDSGS